MNNVLQSYNVPFILYPFEYLSHVIVKHVAENPSDSHVENIVSLNIEVKILFLLRSNLVVLIELHYFYI